MLEPKYPIPDPKNWQAFSLVADIVETSQTPILVSISGAGGAGKSTFGLNLAKYYGTNFAYAIDLDDYLLSREERGKLEVTGYNPVANQLHLAREHLELLLSGNTIEKPRYCHKTGQILPPESVEPVPILIVEGVTALYKQLRDLHTASVFLDAMEETQIKSRITRDVNQRGYTLEQALALFEAIKPDYRRFIEPTKKFATIIFQVSPDYIMHPISK